MAGISQQLLSDARSLVTKMHDRDKFVDSLLSQGQNLNERINCMKEYQEDLHELNESTHQRPRSALVRSLQQENRQIRQLQEENRLLKLALEEHQAALDLIMLRYRQQVLQMVQMNWMQKLVEKTLDEPTTQSSSDDLNKLVEFGHVFRSCLQLGEESALKDQEELARLQAENRTLRQLLKIAAPNDNQAVNGYAQFARANRSQTVEKLSENESTIEMDPIVSSTVSLEDEIAPSSDPIGRRHLDENPLRGIAMVSELDPSGRSSGLCSSSPTDRSRSQSTVPIDPHIGAGDQMIRDVITQLEMQCSTANEGIRTNEQVAINVGDDTNASVPISTPYPAPGSQNLSPSTVIEFGKPGGGEGKENSPFDGHESGYSMWIPSAKTRETLATLSGVLNGRVGYTMPGILFEEPLGDPVIEALRKHSSDPSALSFTRNDLSIGQQHDIPSVVQLVSTGNFRAAINVTGQLLSTLGQGMGRANQPSRNTEESLRIWCLRLHLLVGIGEYKCAMSELEAFGNLDGPDLYYEYYPEIHGGRKGSMVPFSLRLLHAELPRLVGQPDESLKRLNRILAVIKQIMKQLTEDGSLALWIRRLVKAQHALARCFLGMKEFRLAAVVYADMTDEDKDTLESLSGRINLMLGNLNGAKERFQAVDNNRKSNYWRYLHNGYINVANNDFVDAVAAFQEAAKHDPSNIYAINNAATCLPYLGRLDEAVAMLETSIQGAHEPILEEGLCTNLCTLYELQSTRSTQRKVSLLTSLCQHKGDGFNVACLKLAN